MGLTIGLADADIRLPRDFGWHAFRVVQPLILGRVSAIVTMNYAANSVELALFDAFGSKILQTQLRDTGAGQIAASFDQIRLEAGDYLLAFRGIGLAGYGSYKNAHVGLFKKNGLPERILLDELIQQPPVVDPLTQQIIRIGMPAFTPSVE